MYKIVVFDLDGTLVNSLCDLANSVNKGLKMAGLPEHPVQRYKKFVGNGREKLIERAMGGAWEDNIKRSIVKSTFDAEYALHSNDNTVDYPGCADLLQRLTDAGILTAVLSNKPDEFVPAILGKIYPNHKFTEAWGQRAEYRCKPAPDALNAILYKYGIDKRDCLYIGDSDVDVFTANNAGVTVVGVTWGFRGREELSKAGAGIIVDSADEIYRIAVGKDE